MALRDSSKAVDFALSGDALASTATLRAQMWKQGELCDVVLRGTGSASKPSANSYEDDDWVQKSSLVRSSLDVAAHKLELSVASPYLRELIFSSQRPWWGSEVPIIEVDVDATSLKLLVRAIYTGRISLNLSRVEKVLNAAKVLEVSIAVDACVQYLVESLTPHFDAIWEDEAFSSAPSELKILDGNPTERPQIIAKLLSSDMLNATDEICIFRALCKWILALRLETVERVRAFEILLTAVRIPHIPKQYIQNEVKQHILVKSSPTSLEYVNHGLSVRSQWSNSSSQFFDSSRNDALSTKFNWSRRTCMPSSLLCMGGRSSKGEPLRSSETYVSGSSSWAPVPPMNHPRVYASAVAYNQRVYVIGGDPKCTGEALDIAALKWEQMPELITPRSGHRVGLAKGRIVCVGGMDSSGSLLRAVEGFDPREGKWTALPGLQHPRSGAGLATLHDTHVYVIGGIGEGREDLSSVEVLDTRMMKWESGPPLDSRRSNLNGAVVDGQILALGGYQERDVVMKVESLMPFARRWRTITQMKTRCTGFGVASLGTTLFLGGGQENGRYLKSVQYFDVESNSWGLFADWETSRLGAAFVAV